ncbi:hypothetical protein ACFL0O_08850 [Thermodesulfobacteriota bacterium]
MFDEDSSGKDENQGNIKRSPEEGEKRQPSSLLREEAIMINGRPVIISTEAYVTKEDGRLVRQKQIHYQIAADGKWRPLKEYCGFSWTGLLVPKDCMVACLNPFGIHDYRYVFVTGDGDITELGNVLCSECLEYQDKREKWKKRLPLIYNPEIY